MGSNKSPLFNPDKFSSTASLAIGATASSSSVSLPPMCSTPGFAVTQQSAFSVFTNGGQKITILPPLPNTGQRVSSSELFFNMCPVPVTGLMNLSDIHIRRSSDEIVTLTAEW
jgi:hypothetical protein